MQGDMGMFGGGRLSSPLGGGGVGTNSSGLFQFDPTTLFYLSRFGFDPQKLMNPGPNAPSRAMMGGLPAFGMPYYGPNTDYSKLAGPTDTSTIPTNFGFDPSSFNSSMSMLNKVGNIAQGVANRPFAPNFGPENQVASGWEEAPAVNVGGGQLLDPSRNASLADVLAPIRAQDAAQQAGQYVAREGGLANTILGTKNARNDIFNQIQQLKLLQQQARDQAIQGQMGLTGQEQQLAGQQMGLVGGAQDLYRGRLGLESGAQSLARSNMQLLEQILGLGGAQAGATGALFGSGSSSLGFDLGKLFSMFGGGG